MFYLRFIKAMTLTCSSFVHYSWKNLFLQSILKCAERSSSLKMNTDLWLQITISTFWEGNLSTSRDCFLQENTCVGVSFNSEYCEIFKSTYFEEHLQTAASENVFMKLRKIKIYSQEVLKNRFFQHKYQKFIIGISWLVPMKFVFTYNISLV